MTIAMNSIGHSMDLPSISLISRPSHSSCNASGFGLRTPQEGRFSGYERPNELFYEHYGASDYASTSSSTSICGCDWHQRSNPSPSSRCSCSANDPSMRRGPPYIRYGSILDSPPLDKHVGVTAQLPPLPLASKSTLGRDLPPADPDTDYMDHLSPITAEGSLSPLSFYQDWQSNQLPLDPLHNDIYLSSMRLPRKMGLKERVASMHSDDDETSPGRRPYPPLLDIGHEWVTSPESVDTDLDDESILSSSTSSLSPPYPDSDLRHFVDSEEYFDDDDDDLYFTHASSTSSPITDLYHPLEQYPSHYEHLYNPITHEPPSAPQIGEPPPPSPLSICSSFSTKDQFPTGLVNPSPSLFLTKEKLSAELVNATSPSSKTKDNASTELVNTTSELGGALAPSIARPPSLCSFYEFDDLSIPCSPSRRRSKELPTLDDDPFGLQRTCASSLADSSICAEPSPEPPQRTQWLTLPGAETDDDLIPKELASKNYVPDPTITVPSSQRGSLLIWGPTSSRLGTFASDLPTPRSPSPEKLDLDPATLAELAPEGAGEEAQKLYEMRQKTSKRESWERERCRELSALLRLKLKLDEKKPEVLGGTPVKDGKADGDVVENHAYQLSLQPSLDGTPLRSASLPCSSPSSTSSSSTASACYSPQLRSPPRRSSSKARITSMAQLVANMVFHRQQDSPKRSPARSRSLPSPAVAAAQFGARAHPTPRSPLRQVTLPQSPDDMLDDSDDQCLSPLSSLGWCESPLSCLMELEPISMGE